MNPQPNNQTYQVHLPGVALFGPTNRPRDRKAKELTTKTAQNPRPKLEGLDEGQGDHRQDGTCLDWSNEKRNNSKDEEVMRNRHAMSVAIKFVMVRTNIH